jgi:Ca2+-binding RTX toxin-like protein
MSYTLHPSGFIAAPTTLALYDIAMLQSIYGANSETRKEDGSYYGNWGTKDFLCIWDGGGIDDELSAAGMLAPAILDLREGRFSSITNANGSFPTFETSLDNISIAFGAEIENATGTDFRDLIIGNSLNNKLVGGKGNDFIFGDGTIDDSSIDHVLTDRNTVSTYKYPGGNSQSGSGSDTLYGGDDKDQLWGGKDNDFFTGARKKTRRATRKTSCTAATAMTSLLAGGAMTPCKVVKARRTGVLRMAWIRPITQVQKRA